MIDTSPDALVRMRCDIQEAKDKCGWHVNVPPDSVLALIDALEEARGSLREIAAQKPLSELRASGNFCADIEGGYEACIMRARTALFGMGGSSQ